MQHEFEIEEINLQPKLIDPVREFAGGPGEIDAKNIRIRIGRRPLCSNLRKVYEESGREIPLEWKLYDAYDVWMITHVVGIADDGQGGFKNVKQLGYKMRFPEEVDYRIQELAPQTEFVKKIGGDLKFNAGIDFNGKLAGPAKLPFSEVLPIPGFSGEMKVGTDARLFGELSFGVFSKKVITTGVGDFTSEWIFNRDGEPLLGDQMMIQFVLTPKYLEEITFEAMVYANVPAFNMLTDRRKSDWIPIRYEVPEEED